MNNGLSKEVIAWMSSLPKPGDKEGWAKREREMFAAIMNYNKPVEAQQQKEPA